MQNKESSQDYSCLKMYALSFFKRHIGELFLFFKHCRESSADSISTLELLKMFIREKKMPFDMRQYMCAQYEFIQKKLDCKKMTSEKRQEAVSLWIKKYAEEHRDKAIEEQCTFLDVSAGWIVPEIEKMLLEYEHLMHL